MMVHKLSTIVYTQESAELLPANLSINLIGRNKAERLAEPTDSFLCFWSGQYQVGETLDGGWTASRQAQDFTSSEIGLSRCIDRLPNDRDGIHRRHTVNDLNAIPIRFLQTDSISTTGFIDRLDGLRSSFREHFEI